MCHLRKRSRDSTGGLASSSLYISLQTQDPIESDLTNEQESKSRDKKKQLKENKQREVARD